jgi:hypothetical protein
MTMTTLRVFIEADSHGIDFRQDLRSELEIIDQMIKDLQAHKTARRELAVESGYAEFKEVTVKEHIRKEHIQNLTQPPLLGSANDASVTCPSGQASRAPSHANPERETQWQSI